LKKIGRVGPYTKAYIPDPAGSSVIDGGVTGRVAPALKIVNVGLRPEKFAEFPEPKINS